ncbi:DUF397 domain-containing protein [Streptomyces sp. NPDC004296]|uniref:DUF397 domain-containing protein n=1 Tax=Streptomyces sp. NPDC004296 TaxID=3364697 RepID=UPI00367D57DB
MTDTPRGPGVRASDLTDAWTKTSYSSGGEQCIEIADLRQTAHASIAIRDSKTPDGPALLIDTEQFAALTRFAAGSDI